PPAVTPGQVVYARLQLGIGLEREQASGRFRRQTVAQRSHELVEHRGGFRCLHAEILSRGALRMQGGRRAQLCPMRSVPIHGSAPRRCKPSVSPPHGSPGPRSWRPATTGPTAAPGGNAVSGKNPPHRLPAPTNSPAEQLPVPTPASPERLPVPAHAYESLRAL